MKINIGQGQTLFDIALRYYGCYEGVFLLMEDNPVISNKLVPSLKKTPALDVELDTGDELEIRDEVPVLTETNLQNVAYFRQNEMSFNSGYVKPATAGGYVTPGYVTPGYVE